MSNKKRQHRSPDQKAEILRRHHLEKVPVSAVCEEFGLQPSVFYGWQRDLFARAPQVLGPKTLRHEQRRITELERQNAALTSRLAKKDEVIAQISEEYVTLKKAGGEP